MTVNRSRDGPVRDMRPQRRSSGASGGSASDGLSTLFFGPVAASVCGVPAMVAEAGVGPLSRQSLLRCLSLVIGPIPWGDSGPLCHALSLLSWTSMRRRRATVGLSSQFEIRSVGPRSEIEDSFLD